MDQHLNPEKAFFNPCEVFQTRGWLKHCSLRPNFTVLKSIQREALGTYFWGRRRLNWLLHRTICALQRQGILWRGAFERNIQKTEPFPLSTSQNKPYHRHLKVILDKDKRVNLKCNNYSEIVPIQAFLTRIKTFSRE